MSETVSKTMSKGRVLNLTLVAVGLLMLATGGYLGISDRRGGDTAVQLEVAAHQQTLIGALVVHADSLATGTERDRVLAARTALGRTIVSFDHGLGALLAGGQVALEDGRTRRVNRVDDAAARQALEQASHLWMQTGMPLGDLAAGQYSAFSAAGQQALAGLHENHVELARHMADAAEGIRRGAARRAELAAYAVRAVAGLGVAWLALLAARLWPARKPSRPMERAAVAGTRTSVIGHEQASEVDDSRTPAYAAISPTRGRRAEREAPCAPIIDFDNVNAAVDRMSVDMNTIAGSADKMRRAIDSVGFALQGMLCSLNEMAQDTAEGHKIVRNANNAAAFTADACAELVDSAREMSRIVGRVTQLAQRTRQVADQLEGEALETGRTGEAFTSVVAQEVKGLAQQTNRATFEIDQTVNDVLATARQYEEAIGLIIKNVAAINKVSQNLGQLMLDPPLRVQAVAPAPPVAASEAPIPAPAHAVRVEDDPVAPEPTPHEVARATSDAITAAAAEPAVAGPAATAEPATETAPAPTRPVPAPAPVAAAPAGPAAPQADGGSNRNVFMLNKPKGARPAATAEVPAAAAPAEPLPPAPAPAAPVAEAGHGDAPSGSNIFMLNWPKKKSAPADGAESASAVAVAEPPAAAPAPAAMPPKDGATEPPKKNSIILNDPK